MSNENIIIHHRREFLLGLSAFGLSGCMGAKGRDFSALDSQSFNVKEELFTRMPEARQAARDAAGYLIFPSIRKAGFVVGGATGDGTLYAKENVIGHYNIKSASYGLQAGIQSFSMALFFMTPEAMAAFRSRRGFEFGTDIEYALPRVGSISIGASSATYNKPVYALIFNQEGVMVGASLKGAITTQI